MFKSLNIGRRLTIGFATLALLITVIGGFAVYRMATMQADVLHLTHNTVPAIRELGRMATGLAEYRVSERGLVSNLDDPEKFEEYRVELVTGREQFDAMAAAYSAAADNEQLRAAYEAVLAKAALYFANSVRLVEAVQVGDMAPASAAGDLRQATADAIEALLEDSQKALDAEVVTQEAAYARGHTIVIALLALALALAIAAAVLITRSIVRPLAEVLAATDAVSRGDLDHPIAVTERSEVGALANSMRGMVATLRRYSAAQLAMGKHHEAGAISHRIEVDAYQGSYAEMAANTNDLVAAHIAVKLQLVACCRSTARATCRATWRSCRARRRR
jgi:methyl-accepting chemotaxis protein